MSSRALALAMAASLLGISATAGEPFEGRVEAVVTRGEERTTLLYTIGPKSLRLEIVGTKTSEPVDILDLKSGAFLLVFPLNRSFVRLKRAPTEPRSPTAATMPPSGLPPGIGPQTSGISSGGPPVLPIPPIPAMPMPPTEKLELKLTGKKEKILGFACEQFAITERGETIEVWATDVLVPFQNYVRAPAPHFGPRLFEEQWAERLAAKKLFPLRAVLHDETPTERFRFEVKAITPEKVADKDGKLFQPPPEYTEIQPLPL